MRSKPLDPRWALAGLAVTAASALGLALRPSSAAWLLLGLAAWAVGLATGALRLPSRLLGLGLGVFLLSAAFGVWAAYRPEAAWEKFWLVCAALLLCAVLAGQPDANRWPLAAAAGLLGLGAALLYLLTGDWSLQPSKLAGLNPLLLRWMQARPALGSGLVDSDLASALGALSLPFLALRFARSLGRRFWPGALAWGAAGVAVLVALVIATSRSTWLALAGGVLFFLAWRLARRFAGSRRLPAGWIVGAFLLLIVVGAGLAARRPALLVDLFGWLPGPSRTATRLEDARGSLDLIADTPLTGGGLAGFAGQFAHYSRISPYIYEHSSHNLFLDVGVEQGWPGLLALAGVLTLSLAQALTSPPVYADHGLRTALAVGLVIFVIQGILDDMFYVLAGLPFLLLPPGLAGPLAPAGSQLARRPAASWVGVSALTLILLLAGVFYRPLLASLYANLGAVAMSRVELADFPSAHWDDSAYLPRLGPAKALFDKALAWDPANRTANYRLGMIAQAGYDYEAAGRYLGAAYRAAPGSRGIRKVLGLNLVWQGRIAQAQPLLENLPEIQNDLQHYARWWQATGHADLASRAAQMRPLLPTQAVSTAP